jgi:hypothetical protein
MDGAAMVTAIFRYRIEPLMAIDPGPRTNQEGHCMPEITSNAVPCCATDISTGRIWWGWRQDHWVIEVKPASAQKQHKADRHE